MRRLLALVLLVVVAASPSYAGVRGELVLTGHGSAEVVLRSPATLDLLALVPDATAEVSGLVVRDTRGAELGTTVQVRRWTSAVGRPQPLATRDRVSLPAGRYRLELLGTGTVRLPATGGLVRRVQAAGPGRARVELADLRGSTAPAHRFAGLSVRPGSAALLAFFVRATAHQASVPQLCFPEPGAATCAGALGFTTVLASPGSVGDGWAQAFTAVYGGDGVDGEHDALVQDVTVDLPQVLDALLVTS